MTSDAPETDRSHDLNVLLELLDVEQRDEDVFIGQHPEQKTARTFGGQLLGQGVVAATRTLTRGNPPVHALHAHFIRGGAVDKPMEYHVQRYRDGKSFANRQVTARQDGEDIFTMLVAYQDNTAGLEHAIGFQCTREVGRGEQLVGDLREQLAESLEIGFENRRAGRHRVSTETAQQTGRALGD